MTDVSAMTLAVLHRLAEFINNLPEEHVADIAHGRALLSYVPLGASEPVKVRPTRQRARTSAAATLDLSSIVEKLESATSRAEGRELLAPLGLKELQALGKSVRMTGISKTPKSDLVEQIVGLLIGGRLSFTAMKDV